MEESGQPAPPQRAPSANVGPAAAGSRGGALDAGPVVYPSRYNVIHHAALPTLDGVGGGQGSLMGSASSEVHGSVCQVQCVGNVVVYFALSLAVSLVYPCIAIIEPGCPSPAFLF